MACLSVVKATVLVVDAILREVGLPVTGAEVGVLHLVRWLHTTMISCVTDTIVVSAPCSACCIFPLAPTTRRVQDACTWSAVDLINQVRIPPAFTAAACLVALVTFQITTACCVLFVTRGSIVCASISGACDETVWFGVLLSPRFSVLVIRAAVVVYALLPVLL